VWERFRKGRQREAAFVVGRNDVMIGHVDIQPDKIDRRGDDAQIFGGVFRTIFAACAR
jgi:hypothetical protein